MFDEKARASSQALKENLFPDAQRKEKFQMQKAAGVVSSTTFHSAFSTHPYRDTSSCPAPTRLVLQVPRQQLTFKEDCKPEPGEQLNHSWQRGWKHNTLSTASPVFLTQSVLLTWTYLQPLPAFVQWMRMNLPATSPAPFNISLQKREHCMSGPSEKLLFA